MSEERRLALELYAILKNRIDSLSGEAVARALIEYLEEHPTALSEALGLALEDGELCVVMNE